MMSKEKSGRIHWMDNLGPSPSLGKFGPEQKSWIWIFGDPVMMRYLGEAWNPDQVVEALQRWRENWVLRIAGMASLSGKIPLM